MRAMKTIGAFGALLGAALIGGALISSTFAGSTPTAATTQATATGGVLNEEYRDTYLDTLAAELGVDRSALGPAALAAANAAIDAAVAAGDIDEDRATELKDRLAELEDPASLLVRGFGHGGHGGHGGPGMGHRLALGLNDAADAAAEALGIEPADLHDAFRDGTSLEELATQEGVAYDAVKTAVLDAVNTSLADAVADEDITQERADEIVARVTDWLDDGGEGPGFIGGHRGGPRS